METQISSPSKKCTKCHTDKENTLFAKNPKARDGLNNWCKECMKQYHAKNREKHNARTAKWHKDHPERVRELSRKHQRKKRSDPAYCAQLTQRKNEWDKNHPEQRRARERRKNQRRRDAPGRWTQPEWQELLTFYGERCLCCGTTDNITPDHIIPTSKGGSHWISNIQPLCISCNSSKGARVIDFRLDKSSLYLSVLQYFSIARRRKTD